MKNGRCGGFLGVRIVAVEGLEEPRALVVESTELQVAQLLANLVGHDEARVDDLPRGTVAKLFAVLGAPDRILDPAELPDDGLQLLVLEGAREPEADDPVRRQRLAKNRRVRLSSCRLYAEHLCDTEGFR